MAMKVKAVEKLLKFDKNSAGVYRYVMSPEMYSSLNQKKVIKEAALRSGVSQGVMQACWDAAGEVIKAWATEGHSVALPGLGTMRFGLRSKSVEDVNKVKSNLITSRRIIFTPDTDLKDELKNTSVVITCYDRNGNEVKRVTSDDDAEVEDPENGSTGDGERRMAVARTRVAARTPVVTTEATQAAAWDRIDGRRKKEEVRSYEEGDMEMADSVAYQHTDSYRNYDGSNLVYGVRNVKRWDYLW